MTDRLAPATATKIVVYPFEATCETRSAEFGSPPMTEDPTARRNPLRSAPNLLTVLRICLAPFLVSAILEDRFVLSFILFIAAGLTDALDGVLARVLKQRTMLGEYLDPIADKLL